MSCILQQGLADVPWVPLGNVAVAEVIGGGVREVSQIIQSA